MCIVLISLMHYRYYWIMSDGIIICLEVLHQCVNFYNYCFNERGFVEPWQRTVRNRPKSAVAEETTTCDDIMSLDVFYIWHRLHAIVVSCCNKMKRGHVLYEVRQSRSPCLSAGRDMAYCIHKNQTYMHDCHLIADKCNTYVWGHSCVT